MPLISPTTRVSAQLSRNDFGSTWAVLERLKTQSFCSWNNRKTTRKRPDVVWPGQASKKTHPLLVEGEILCCFVQSFMAHSMLIMHDGLGILLSLDALAMPVFYTVIVRYLFHHSPTLCYPEMAASVILFGKCTACVIKTAGYGFLWIFFCFLALFPWQYGSPPQKRNCDIAEHNFYLLMQSCNFCLGTHNGLILKILFAFLFFFVLYVCCHFVGRR